MGRFLHKRYIAQAFEENFVLGIISYETHK